MVVAPSQQATVTVTVLAGGSRTVVGTGTVPLDGQVIGDAVSTTWTMLSGPGNARFADDTPQTTVIVPVPGSYVFQLTATDRAGRSWSSQTNLTVLRFVALGDSYSSGDGSGPVADYLPGSYSPLGGCRRSRDAYPAILDAVLATGSPAASAASDPLFTFGACSGARTGDFSAPQRPDIPPQNTYLDGPAGTVGLVTLTLGGNDIGFADIATYCAALHVTTLLESCREHSEPAVRAALDALRPKLAQIYQVITGAGSLSQPAQVLAVGYPRLFPGRLDAPCPISILGKVGVRVQPDDAAWINQVVHDLDSMIESAAAVAGVTYVNTEDAFAGHEFCNSQGNPAYVNLLGSPFATPFHPNGPGHHALATVVMAAYHPIGR
jgi:hypothetical protein